MPAAAAQLRERARVDDVAADAVVQVRLPVPPDRAADVALVVAVVSTSTSTSFTFGSFRCSATQPVRHQRLRDVRMSLLMTGSFVSRRSLLDDLLPLKLLGLLVQHPARHVRRLAAWRSRRSRSCKTATRARGRTRSGGRGGPGGCGRSPGPARPRSPAARLGLHQLPAARSRSGGTAPASSNTFGTGSSRSTTPPPPRVAAVDDAAALVRVRGGAFRLDLPACGG